MAEDVNVRLSGRLKDFVKSQVTPGGLYESASKYVRNLIRQDFESTEKRKWNNLLSELTPGLEADEEDCKEVLAKDVIERCKKRKAL